MLGNNKTNVVVPSQTIPVKKVTHCFLFVFFLIIIYTQKGQKTKSCGIYRLSQFIF